MSRSLLLLRERRARGDEAHLPQGGAHRKEARERAGETPERKEYRRAYNRLKQKKLRGKISADEWNVAVAQAQELLARAEKGELGEGELKKQLGVL